MKILDAKTYEIFEILDKELYKKLKFKTSGRFIEYDKDGESNGTQENK